MKMEAAVGEGAGKDKNIHSPTHLLIFDHRSPNSLPSLPLPLKSKMAAIIFTKKILNTCCPKLRQLCRLSYMGRPTSFLLGAGRLYQKNIPEAFINYRKRTLIMCTYHCLSISEAGSVWKRSMNMWTWFWENDDQLNVINKNKSATIKHKIQWIVKINNNKMKLGHNADDLKINIFCLIRKSNQN